MVPRVARDPTHGAGRSVDSGSRDPQERPGRPRRDGSADRTLPVLQLSQEAAPGSVGVAGRPDTHDPPWWAALLAPAVVWGILIVVFVWVLVWVLSLGGLRSR